MEGFRRWLKGNWKTAAIIAVIFYFALTNVLGGVPNFAAKKYLQWAKGWYEAFRVSEVQRKANDAAWKSKLNEAEGKYQAVLNRPKRPAPTSATETVARFKEMGYSGRVR